MKKRILSVFFALVLVLSFSLVTATPVAAADLNVPSQYSTIQAAINAANPGDTIIVSDGTYISDLTIPSDKTNLEIVSVNGASVTTIKGVANAAVGVWPLAVPNIDIRADGVKIHGFTIKGPDYVVDYYASGIVLDGLGIEIYDNDFVTTRADTTDELAHAITTYSLTAGLPEDADPSGLNIHDNTFVGSGDIGSEFIYVNPHTGSGTITIDSNQFSGSVFIGITAESGEVSCTNNTINNGTEGSGLYGIRFMDTTYEGNYANIVVSNNTIQNTDKAIRVGNGGAGNSVFTAVISNNTLTNNDIGVWGRLGNNTTVVDNSIAGNGVGVQNDGAVTINAINNWWGDASGPYHATTNPSGTGDAVSDLVNFDPWLTQPPSSVVMTASFTPSIGISVTPTSIDFGAVAPGTPSAAQTVTVTNTGNVAEDFEASLDNISDPDVYTTGLRMDGALVAAWEELDVAVASTATPDLILTVPGGAASGTYTATLIFWAEEATP